MSQETDDIKRDDATDDLDDVEVEDEATDDTPIDIGDVDHVITDEAGTRLDLSDIYGGMVKPTGISGEVRQSFLEYAMSVIVARALPDARDGLKPVQRRILYAMGEAGITYTKPHKKSAWSVGEVMGKYHPHGDCYDPSTVIKLLNGNTPTIKELAEKNEDVWILTVSADSGQIIPAKAHDFRIGQYANDLYHIKFTNGYELVVTDNHPFLDINGQWWHTKDIRPLTILDTSEIFVENHTGYQVIRSVTNTVERKHTYLHQLVANAEGICENGKILHHIDENKYNNSPDNITTASRAEHAVIHDNYGRGLETGRQTMFADDGRLREATRKKNSLLMASYNANQGLGKALHALNILEERGLDLTEENYESLHPEVYNLTKIDRMIKRGNIKDFDDLVAKHNNHERVIDPTEATGLTDKAQIIAERAQNAKHCSNMLPPLRVMQLIARKYKNHETPCQIQYSDMDNSAGNNSVRNHWSEAEFNEFRDTHMAIVESVTVEHLDEPRPMYDFTVDHHHNMLLPINDDCTLFCCGHNSSIYEAMCHMAQDFSMELPLVDGHGNFGSIDGDKQAAMRYTESRLSRAANYMLQDIDEDVVDTQPNYDESLEEPVVLPAHFPNLLVNGSKGIAVGIATNIAPHNLGEVIDATCAYIDDADISVDALMRHLPGPDFPTGGTVCGTDSIRECFATGKGTIVLRSRVHIERGHGDRSAIVITEIPYQVNKAELHKQIVTTAEKNPELGIAGVTDESNRKGIRLVVRLKAHVEAKVVLANLMKTTNMQVNYSVNDIALVNGRPRQLPLKDMLSAYVAHATDVATRRSEHRLAKSRHDLLIQEGLLAATSKIDEVVRTIRAADDDATATAALRTLLAIDEEQASAILSMQLRRLTKMNADELEARIAAIKTDIATLEHLLEDHDAMMEAIKADLRDVGAKLGSPRRTTIEAATPAELEVEDLIADEQMVVTFTHAGYVKRVPASLYKSQGRGGKGKIALSLKDGDVTEDIAMASTHDDILLFTNDGRVFKKKVHELPPASRTSRGTHIANVIGIDGKTVHVCAHVICSGEPNGDTLVFATKRGITKRVLLTEFTHVTQGGKIAMTLGDGDEIVNVLRSHDENDLVVLTSCQGYTAVSPISAMRPLSRTARGSKGLGLRDGDSLLCCQVAHGGEDVLVITENGYGKRTSLSSFAVRARGAKGVLTLKRTSQKGDIACALVVNDRDEVMVITRKGIAMRLKVSQVRESWRITQGVRVMDITDDDAICTMTKVRD